MSELDDLHKLDWMPIHNAPYIMKYVFHEDGYTIMISNLTLLYSEKPTASSIRERFYKLNPFVQMKSQVIIENLKRTLQKCLAENIELCMKVTPDKFIISIEFHAARVLCSYDIEMDLMGADKVTHYIIGPTVLNALLSQRKILELQKRILSVESTKSSLSSNISIASQNAIDQNWLVGQNVPIETVLDSFLKIQTHFKDLYAENLEAYHSIKKEKSKKELSIQSVSPHKRQIDESTSIQFEDNENISIKEEPVHSDVSLQNVKTDTKKKKVFKI